MPTLPITLDIYRVDPGKRDLVRSVVLREKGSYLIGRHTGALFPVEDSDVSREHCLIEVRDQDVVVTDRSRAGTSIGSTPITRAVWDGSEDIRIPHFEIRWRKEDGARQAAAAPAGQREVSRLGQQEFSSIFGLNTNEEADKALKFPGNVFTTPVMACGTIYNSGFFNGECEYLALGGGMGSFVWVNHLRVYGVPPAKIRVLGQDPVPYTNYARYCRNSQIPLHERLRSNSISTPDNIWGFPGYASRETWTELKQGKFSGLAHIFDVFGEPAIRQSYTPKAGDVFRSVDVEAARIGWRECFLQGKILSMRKTDDGRFAVAYRVTSEGFQGRRDNIIIARFVHISVGYPATRYTDDVQEFIHNFRDDRHLIANAYEPHDGLYEQLEKKGKSAIVVVRGRGIVASRILQRLKEARQWNAQITIVHQMRNPIPDGQGEKWGRAQRLVINDVEHQAFNWPKACWGGSYRKEIERSDPLRRARMYKSLGGTTTAVRRDWLKIVADGAREGWYRKSFGNIVGLKPEGAPNDRKLMISIGNRGAVSETISANYIVDCTGLIADPEQSPFLRDIIRTYELPRNKASGPGGEQRVTGIAVSNNYEIEGLRNGRGRVYASGALTQNGPYAAVDSFLGLAYTALRSVDQLGSLGAPDVSTYGPLRSASQWVKWCSGKTPEGRSIAV